LFVFSGGAERGARVKAETWNGQPKGQNKKRNWFCKSHELPLCWVAKNRKKFILMEETNYTSFKRAAATLGEYYYDF
jgi:hypothetical protein